MLLFSGSLLILCCVLGIWQWVCEGFSMRASCWVLGGLFWGVFCGFEGLFLDLFLVGFWGLLLGLFYGFLWKFLSFFWEGFGEEYDREKGTIRKQ